MDEYQPLGGECRIVEHDFPPPMTQMQKKIKPRRPYEPGGLK